jgi:hypothetical protein
MANKVDTLLSKFELVIKENWTSTLSTSERVMFLVYDPAEQRKVDFRLSDFETATKKAEKKWLLISFKNCFPSWMSKHDYRDEYFLHPEDLTDQLEVSFKKYAVDYLNDFILQSNADEQTLLAIKDVSSLYGFVRLSEIINAVNNTFKGRLVIFFPGEYENNQYRLLDARDGWSYLARPITV